VVTLAVACPSAAGWGISATGAGRAFRDCVVLCERKGAGGNTLALTGIPFVLPNPVEQGLRRAADFGCNRFNGRPLRGIVTATKRTERSLTSLWRYLLRARQVAATERPRKSVT